MLFHCDMREQCIRSDTGYTPSQNNKHKRFVFGKWQEMQQEGSGVLHQADKWNPRTQQKETNPDFKMKYKGFCNKDASGAPVARIRPTDCM